MINFRAELLPYGENGRFPILVAGPFSNMPDDFKVLVVFLARIRAMRLLHPWDTTPGIALALIETPLCKNLATWLPYFGLWARLILGRFRDVVSRIHEYF